MTVVDFIVPVATAMIAFGWGWAFGANREWSKAHSDACAVTKAHRKHLDELRMERDVERANGAAFYITFPA